ncbi:MAG: hypothetical protein E7173_03200 [Firmicutes bacterium]|nr:hypothetical protein [Bacillota bacterium]
MKKVVKLFLVMLTVTLLALLGFGGYKYFKEHQEQLKLEQQELEEKRDKKRQAVIAEAEILFKGYYVDEAIKLLESDQEIINDKLQELIKSYKEYKDSYVLYEGTVHHIFFHSLILYPEYLFKDITIPTGGYNEGFSYKRELERMLPLLLENNFVLYNIKDVYTKDENGKMIRKEIYLPEGKKPLILSVDDPALSYGKGFADQMIIDENGNLATKVITPDNETIITYDGDVELVVNNFIKEHPEFSYRGARGIIATTGWEGFLGYDLRTEESVQEAKKVADKLKEEGWLFASHSYTHNRQNYFGPNSNPANIKSDTTRWLNRMVPVVGETDIFIAPFGYRLKGAGLDVILDNGFDIYCTVASTSYEELHDDYALMSRIEMGGYSYRWYRDYISEHLFDVSKVKDSYRPPVSNE